MNPKVKWSEERITAQQEMVQSEINILSGEVTNISTQISNLIENKLILQRKIGDKQRYWNQLEKMKTEDE